MSSPAHNDELSVQQRASGRSDATPTPKLVEPTPASQVMPPETQVAPPPHGLTVISPAAASPAILPVPVEPRDTQPSPKPTFDVASLNEIIAHDRKMSEAHTASIEALKVKRLEQEADLAHLAEDKARLIAELKVHTAAHVKAKEAQAAAEALVVSLTEKVATAKAELVAQEAAVSKLASDQKDTSVRSIELDERIKILVRRQLDAKTKMGEAQTARAASQAELMDVEIKLQQTDLELRRLEAKQDEATQERLRMENHQEQLKLQIEIAQARIAARSAIVAAYGKFMAGAAGTEAMNLWNGLRQAITTHLSLPNQTVVELEGKLASLQRSDIEQRLQFDARALATLKSTREQILAQLQRDNKEELKIQGRITDLQRAVKAKEAARATAASKVQEETASWQQQVAATQKLADRVAALTTTVGTAGALATQEAQLKKAAEVDLATEKAKLEARMKALDLTAAEYKSTAKSVEDLREEIQSLLRQGRRVQERLMETDVAMQTTSAHAEHVEVQMQVASAALEDLKQHGRTLQMLLSTFNLALPGGASVGST